MKQKTTYNGNNTKNLHISVEASLKKLRTDYIDILYLHWWDYSTSVEEVMNSLHNLVAQGKVDLKPLVTHRYSFEQAVEAFQVTRQGKSADGKAVIKAVISGPDVSPDDIL